MKNFYFALISAFKEFVTLTAVMALASFVAAADDLKDPEGIQLDYPRNVKIVNQSNSGAVVQWDAVASAKGYLIDLA